MLLSEAVQYDPRILRKRVWFGEELEAWKAREETAGCSGLRQPDADTVIEIGHET